tara:strand:- start:201 stop:434 length:234 start_codon:yes stop_codon:yes gene_type:complete
MGKPKKNKKAEIKARRKSRKAQERITYLRKKESILKVMLENKEAFQKLAEAEQKEDTEVEQESTSSEDDQSNQSSCE